MRVLITGASGFAGSYLARACAEAGDDVVGVSRSGVVPKGAGVGVSLDLGDGSAVRRVLADAAPAVVYHLAALSSVGRSWEDPATTLRENVATALAVLEGVRLGAPSARVVWVSTCEVYGTPRRLPIEESAPVNPANPYAVSKASGDLLAGVYADAHGLDIIRARAFSHAGPGQQPFFIVSSLARQAAEARAAGAASLRVVTGNPDTRRDFTDVRDVARAYRLLAARLGPGRGAVYNVCSGRSVSAAEQVALLSALLDPIEVEHVIDPARVRAHEVMDLRGACGRITADTGWRPEIPFEQTVSDTIAYWERRVRAERQSSAARPSLPT